MTSGWSCCGTRGEPPKPNPSLSVIRFYPEGAAVYLGGSVFKNLSISLAKRRTLNFIIQIILMHWFIVIAIQGQQQLL